MKRIAILVVVLVLTLGLAPFAYAAKPIPTMLADVDINTVDGVVTYTTTQGTAIATSFNPEQPGGWGGEYGGGAVTAFPGDTDPAGYINFKWTTGFARHIELRMLDGIADDSFNVYVMNPGGDWALVYSYTSDLSTNEYWVVHDIYGFPAGKGKQGPSINMMIVPTNLGWSGFNTWGQLAVDWVKVYDH